MVAGGKTIVFIKNKSLTKLSPNYSKHCQTQLQKLSKIECLGLLGGLLELLLITEGNISS